MNEALADNLTPDAVEHCTTKKACKKNIKTVVELKRQPYQLASGLEIFVFYLIRRGLRLYSNG